MSFNAALRGRKLLIMKCDFVIKLQNQPYACVMLSVCGFFVCFLQGGNCFDLNACLNKYTSNNA